MGKFIWKLRRLYRWRPSIWKEFLFSQHLWEDTRSCHREVREQEKKFMIAISKCDYSEHTMKNLENIYVYMKSAWLRIQGAVWHFGELKHKSLQPTPIELKIHHEYREATYRIFYRCSELLLDTRIKVGKSDPSKRAAHLNWITYLRDNRGI